MTGDRGVVGRSKISRKIKLIARHRQTVFHALIKLVSGRVDLRQMLLDPTSECQDRLRHRTGQFGQPVFDLRRAGREDRSGHHAVAFEDRAACGLTSAAKCHPCSVDVVETARAVSQQHDDEHAPLLTERREDWLILRQSSCSGWCNSAVISMCPGRRKSAFLRYGISHIPRLGHKHGLGRTAMKLLHIDSSISGEASASRQLSAAIVHALTGAARPRSHRRDLEAIHPASRQRRLAYGPAGGATRPRNRAAGQSNSCCRPR